MTLLPMGCGTLVQYTDEITQESTGRSWFVRTPAAVGGMVGFVVGIPVDVVALPITYPVYRYQLAQDPIQTEWSSVLLFPSFVLWRAGRLLGAPFDVLEFLAYRAWSGPQSMTREERERIEVGHDDESLSSYPVEPLFPGRLFPGEPVPEAVELTPVQLPTSR